MSKELVVSSTSHETRVAILDDDKLAEIYIERASEHALVGSVYKGRVSRVLPGMQSAFVKIGLERDAFLYVSDIIDQTEDIESGALDDDADVAVAGAPAPRPTREETPADEDEQEGSEPGGRRRRGRRSRRGRGRNSRFPESKFADLEASEEADSEAREKKSRARSAEEEAPEQEDLAVLPGESLAKYAGESAPVADEDETVVEQADSSETESPRDESRRGGRRRRRRRGRRGGRDRARGGEEETSSAEPSEEESHRLEAEDREADEDVVEEAPEEESVETDSDDVVEEADDVEDSGDDASDQDDDSDGADGEEDEDEESSDLEDENQDDEGDESLDNDSEEEQDEEEDSDEDEDEDYDSEQEAEDDEEEDSEQGAEGEEQEEESGSEEKSEGADEERGAAKADDKREKPGAEAGVRERGGSRHLKRGRRGRRRRGREGEEKAESRGPSEDRKASTPRPDSSAGPLITELLKPGQEIIVQIAKEPLGKKGARITSHIALPGRYLVYMPTVAHVGVSRKISSDAERVRLRRIIRENSEGAPGGFIVRTAGQGKSEEDLIADINFLTDSWKAIQEKAEKRPAPALLHTDLDIVERILRDHLGQSYKTIWVDSEEEYERIVSFLERFQKDLLDRVKLYTRSTPIFDEFKITQEIEKALRPKVWLKSGGYIVINQTEALVAIDVNTGKYVGKSDRLEDTIVKTNLEAVQEIVRQMRLRDLGGIIVVDFIDMDDKANRKKVAAALEKELRYDRSPSKALAFNDFGLVAITRKRVKQSLERALCAPCSACQGSGYVKSPESVAYEILNDARRLAPKRTSRKDVSIRCHPDVAKLLKSRDNSYLQELEEILGVNVIVRGDHSLYADNFDIN